MVKQTSTGEKQVTASAGAQFRWPAQGRVISNFGDRVAGGANDGIDISVPVGTPVKASETGTVIYSGSELEDFGNLILLSSCGVGGYQPMPMPVPRWFAGDRKSAEGR